MPARPIFVITSGGTDITSRKAFKEWVWAVREDGMLTHNWVERNALEVHRELTGLG